MPTSGAKQFRHTRLICILHPNLVWIWVLSFMTVKALQGACK